MLVILTAYALVKTSIMVYVWIYENNVTFNKKILPLPRKYPGFFNQSIIGSLSLHSLPTNLVCV